MTTPTKPGYYWLNLAKKHRKPQWKCVEVLEFPGGLYVYFFGVVGNRKVSEYSRKQWGSRILKEG